ncbi:manganese dependent peroxidase 1 [Lactarius quietus]|nr:manganese dependent peroxidase 1 [Lactarius quietus]
MPLGSLVVISALVCAISAALTRRAVPCPDGVHSAMQPACCALYPIVDRIQENLFDGGECGDEVHESLRLTFHDAIGFSLSRGPSGNSGGGADGSIMTFSDIETQYAANGGLDDIVKMQERCLSECGGDGILSPGDFIQLAGAVGVSNCPGAPRLRFLLGRPNATAPAPDDMVPAPFDSTDVIFARFADAGFNTDEVVALLASHSIAASKIINPSIAGAPFDTTPDVFDTQFFLEELLRSRGFHGAELQRGQADSPIEGEMRIMSDYLIARDSRTSCTWQSFINNQARMADAFGNAMAKLAVLGQDTSNMIDCSEVIPVPKSLPFEHSQCVYPAGFSKADVEQACSAAPFPSLSTVPGPMTSVTPV